MNKWITILKVDLPVDAQLIRSILEMEGIDAAIPDEYTADVAPFYSQAIGGIRIQVNAKDFDQALAILTENGYPKSRAYSRKQSSEMDQSKNLLCLFF